MYQPYLLCCKNQEFIAFTKNLVEKYHPLYIFGFGEATEMSIRTGRIIKNSTEGNRHYHLLLVTESVNRIEHHVQDYANQHFHFGTITVLVHGMDTVAHALCQNNRFFITVFNSGQLLYCRDASVQSLKVTNFIPTHAATRAAKHYEHHNLLASGFLHSASECRGSGKNQLCLFMLHQVVEQCCIALMRVYLGYRSDIHNLYRLLRLCESFSLSPIKHFLPGAKEAERLFNVMLRSYSAARYQDDFCVTPRDTGILYNRVSSFMDLTNRMCLEKIQALAVDAEIHKLTQEAFKEIQAECVTIPC